jgi:hypothetical protein
MSKILHPHSSHINTMRQLEMLFQFVDLEGERRRAAVREEKEKMEEERKLERKRKKALGLLGSIEADADKVNVGIERKLKWWQKVDASGKLILEGGDDNAGAVGAGGKKKEKKNFKRPTSNHRTFHFVLACNRGARKRDRDLRLGTHENKRACQKELMRFFWERERKWWWIWEDQEKALERALESYMKDIKDREERQRKERESDDEEVKEETREERKMRRESQRLGKGNDDEIEEAAKKEEGKEEIFDTLRKKMWGKTELNYRSWNDTSFMHNLIKFNRERAFSRATWVKYRARRSGLEDIDERGRELDGEIGQLEAIKTCRLGFRHQVREERRENLKGKEHKTRQANFYSVFAVLTPNKLLKSLRPSPGFALLRPAISVLSVTCIILRIRACGSRTSTNPRLGYPACSRPTGWTDTAGSRSPRTTALGSRCRA